MINKNLTKRFINLFDAYTNAYGTLVDLKEDENGKVNGRNVLKKDELTEDNFTRHLEGVVGLRLIPLKENNKLRYAAIDLDKNNHNSPLRDTLSSIEEKIKKLGLPLIPCSSKSGDIHLYCFAKEDIDAKVFMSRINEWSSLLGYGAAEKFPKQVSRINNDDHGQPLNVPYFDAKKTERYAWNKGKKLTLEEFLEYAEISSVTENEIKTFKYEDLDESYDDAPPCVQMLASAGIKEGARNNGLFGLAVYFKKKFPESFEDKIMEANYKIISPSLPLSDVTAITKSVNKKDFFYKCNEAPCAQFCNKSECHKRKYGIGNTNLDSDSLVIDNISKHQSGDSVMWIVECQGERVSMSTEELYNPRAAIMKIWEKTNKVMKPVKAEIWIGMLKNLMQTLVIIEDPEDVSDKGQFTDLFTNWLESFGSNLPKEKTALFFQGIYHDPTDDKIKFKFSKLKEYLTNKKFNVEPQLIWRWIHELYSGKSEVTKIKEAKSDKYKSERVCVIKAVEIFDKRRFMEDKL